MLSIKKIKKKYGGLICRSCLNENYPRQYIHHNECIYTNLEECPLCKENKYLVRSIKLVGRLRLILNIK